MFELSDRTQLAEVHSSAGLGHIFSAELPDALKPRIAYGFGSCGLRRRGMLTTHVPATSAAN